MSTTFADRDLRQRQIVPPEKLARVHALVVGVGAVGRQVALQLASMGIPELTLVDHDVVDVVNLAPQGYAPGELGLHKVQATGEGCQRLNPELMVRTYPERFRRSLLRSLSVETQTSLVMFCCVDSIATRGVVWQTVKSAAAFFADARMSGEVVRVLASGDPSHEQHYPTTLFAAEEAYVGSCTARSTIYCASIAAGLMLQQLTRWLREIPVERDLLLNLLASELTVNELTVG